MNKRQSEAIIRKIEKHMHAVKLTRDRIDDDMETLQELREDCDEAYDHLQRARDALSELV